MILCINLQCLNMNGEHHVQIQSLFAFTLTLVNFHSAYILIFRIGAFRFDSRRRIWDIALIKEKRGNRNSQLSSRTSFHTLVCHPRYVYCGKTHSFIFFCFSGMSVCINFPRYLLSDCQGLGSKFFQASLFGLVM